MTSENYVSQINMASRILIDDFSDPAEIAAFLAPLILLRFLNFSRNNESTEIKILNETSNPLVIWMSDQADFFKNIERYPEHPIGDLLNKAFHFLSTENPEYIGDLFSGIDYQNRRLGNRDERQRKLTHVVKQIASIRYEALTSLSRSASPLSELFVQIQEVSFNTRRPLEFVTPNDVGLLLSAVTEPQSGDHVYDPACGTGQLILACIRQISSNGGYIASAYGDEKNYWAWVLARINLIFCGYSPSGIVLRDSINAFVNQPSQSSSGFDVIVSNPPKGLRDWFQKDLVLSAYEELGFGLPPRSNADYAFILLMLRSMHPTNGRMAVVVTNGALFRQGAEDRIREHLVQRNLVDAVIALPAKIFLSTSASMSIILIKAQRQKQGIFFVDARRLGETRENHTGFSNAAIDKIAAAIREKNNTPEFSVLTSIDKISENNYSLLPWHYVLPNEKNITFDLVSLVGERQRLQEELTLVENSLEEILDSLIKCK